MERDFILSHIDDLTALQLTDAIFMGVVTIDDLRATNNLDVSKRQAIIALKAERESAELANQLIFDKKDDDEWENAKYGNEYSLRDYISKFPNGKYLELAKERIDDLENQRRNLWSRKQEVLDRIKQNSNLYSPNEIIDYLDNGVLTRDELIDYCGIPTSAVDNLSNIKVPSLVLGKTPTAIPDGYTEVYFWGYPGSGKTCALGAVLQMANKRGYLNIATGPGFHYANQLTTIFSHNGEADDFLPAPTPEEVTQYLPFSLKKVNERVERSVSLIELSGEIFKCFYLKNAGMEFPNVDIENTFMSLDNYLKSKNRKIHFFFVDYTKDDKPDDDGISQGGYLSAASTYFDNKNVFNKTTDAIYIVLTKSDLMLDSNGNSINDYNQRVECAKTFLQTNYLAFVNSLKNNCRKYSINGGKLEVEPFSLGKVYFKKICDFDGTSADRLVNILLERIQGTRSSILDIFNK
jgi:hypothetical protein